MAYLWEYRGQEYLCEAQDSENQKVRNHNRKNRVIENQLILIAGEAGTGKTVYSNTLAEELNQEGGHTIIVLTEKKGTEMDWGYRQFPPTSKEQIEALKEQEEPIATKKELQDNTIIYSPLTLETKGLLIENKNVKTEKIPPIKWYSHPISSLDEESLSCLLRGQIDDETVNTAVRNIKKLKKTDWLHELANNIRESIREKTEYEYDAEKFGIDIGESTDKSTVKKIITGLTALRQNPFYMPEDSEYNIDMTEIINDNKHRHVFTRKFITDKRLRYLSLISDLKAIENALTYGKIKNPICLVIEEVPYWLSRSPDTIYQKELLRLILSFQRIGRSMGLGITMILTTQNIQALNRQLFISCNNKRVFRLNDGDVAYLLKYGYVTTELSKRIKTLRNGQFIYWSEKRQDLEDSIRIKAYVPRYSFHKVGTNYYTEYNKYYPEKLVSYKEHFTKLEEFITVRDNKAKDNIMEKIQIEKSKTQEIQIRKAIKKNKTDETKDNNKELRKQLQIHIIKLSTEKNLSYRKIAEDNTVKALWNLIKGTEKINLMTIKAMLETEKPE